MSGGAGNTFPKYPLKGECIVPGTIAAAVVRRPFANLAEPPAFIKPRCRIAVAHFQEDSAHAAPGCAGAEMIEQLPAQPAAAKGAIDREQQQFLVVEDLPRNKEPGGGGPALFAANSLANRAIERDQPTAAGVQDQRVGNLAAVPRFAELWLERAPHHAHDRIDPVVGK